MLANYLNRKIPPYYKTMYLDGFEPWQILEAKRQEMRSKFFDNETEDYEVHFTSEIKVK